MANLIAGFALAISLVSLGFSIYFGLRDRARVKAESEFYLGLEGDAPHMVISIVNAGRRSVLLTFFGGNDSQGDWAGTHLDSKGKGFRLAEGEKHRIDLYEDDLELETPEGIFIYKELWVEDTLGRRYAVKHSKEHIRCVRGGV
ncbi:MAG: hypothetical protein KAR36_00505 [Candidatus Latescibacteria bacterium]|nr:hypothetical protein [Candidatus Latescibacterota bacterium]